MTRRRLAVAVTIVMAVLAVPLLSSSAHAEAPPPGGSSDYVVWDGTTTSLNWDGSTSVIYQSPVSTPYFTVPGDEVTHAATIRNGGPTAATVTVDILNMTTTNQPDTVNTDLENIVLLFWDINGDTGESTWRQARLASDDRHVSYSTSFPLDQGDSFPLTVGFHFPSSATGGQSQGGPSSVLTFDVRVTMTGATPGFDASTGGLTLGGVTIPWWLVWTASFMVMSGTVFMVEILVNKRRRTEEQPAQTCIRTAARNP
ncbi:MAG: hypothetical protein FWF43_00705 [Propionibacteriaceae bacterium]|nr:hypothetical protein [Propionibacteriaceae bacterium]